MLPHLWTTLRLASRSTAIWALAILGALSTLVGLGLSVLAMGAVASTGPALLYETVATTSALAGLWLLASCHEVDQRSGFTPALDATRPGVLGRQGGRLLGALAVSAFAGLPAALTGWWVLGDGAPPPIYLLVTTIPSTLLLMSWALVLLVATSSGQTALLAGLAVWIGGHLPWGQPAWGGQDWGRAASALLPGGEWPSQVLASLGWILLSAAFLARPLRAG